MQNVPEACDHNEGAAALSFRNGLEEAVANCFPVLLQMLRSMDSDSYNLPAKSGHRPAVQDLLNEDPVHADIPVMHKRGLHRSQRLHRLVDCLSKRQSVVPVGRELNLIACDKHALLKICEKVLQQA